MYFTNEFHRAILSQELVPGIDDADLKAMQKPPMRSFDPAILQETRKGGGEDRRGQERTGEDRSSGALTDCMFDTDFVVRVCSGNPEDSE
eukprot:Skav223842  [mRNA]  locus=scaffold2304:115567:115836:- [translate_table: standard]